MFLCMKLYPLLSATGSIQGDPPDMTEKLLTGTLRITSKVYIEYIKC